MKTENTNYQVTEVKLVYKTQVKAADRVKIESSKSAYAVLKQLWDTDSTENFEKNLKSFCLIEHIKF